MYKTYSSIAKVALTTAITFFSNEDVSFSPYQETSVDVGGVIWNTPIRAERIAPILLPVDFAIFMARCFAFSVASASISTLSSASFV